MQFEKYHALGNDYLVLDPQSGGQLPGFSNIVRICHRNFGLGSDGILYGPLPSEHADFGLRILNPDGSEAEKSGNGLRIFARYLYDIGAVQHAPFTVDTLGGLVTCTIKQNASTIEVEMGIVQFGLAPTKSEAHAASAPLAALKFPFENKYYTGYAADIGNPHCVLPVENVSKELACQLGPLIERDERFANKTNVQFLQVIDRSTIQIEIWERGAGYTLASGSSSSAAAAVAHRLGLCDGSIAVRMPGGQIDIVVQDDYAINMRGPATKVATMHLAAEALL
jgi:diaminopimelate epimerase